MIMMTDSLEKGVWVKILREMPFNPTPNLSSHARQISEFAWRFQNMIFNNKFFLFAPAHVYNEHAEKSA